MKICEDIKKNKVNKKDIIVTAGFENSSIYMKYRGKKDDKVDEKSEHSSSSSESDYSKGNISQGEGDSDKSHDSD